MLQSTLAAQQSRAARTVTWSILGVNAVLLLISLPDYRVAIDSGYHISLARWYAAHGSAWWDHINYGPGGRPNLQGPGLHVAIAILGKLLGGTPDDFILSNAILGIAQWTAAMLTALYFARRLGGDLAAMFAVALLAGGAYASGSFYVGIPSGWIFISVPWAIHFFLEDRLVLAALVISAGCYTHLGGYMTAPVGVAIAAAMERRWRSLIKVGAAAAILTAPYTIHFLSNLAWYRGRHGHEALQFDFMIDLLAIAGAILYFRHPARHRFLFAWALAPIAWLAQDPSRFVLQSALAGSVLGGLFLADMMGRIAQARMRTAFAVVMVALATVFPLGPPNLAAEAAWDAGLRFPRMLDWDRARALAGVIAQNHLGGRLISVYASSFGPAIAVFTPVTLEKGHWVEVQPLHDPAEDLAAEAKVYVIPLAPGDPVLATLDKMGLIRVWGGTTDAAVITLENPGDAKTVQPIFTRLIEENATWLGANAVNNQTPKLFTPSGLAARKRTMDEQRFHAGRMEVACLVYSHALEAESPEGARGLRGAARGFGAMVGFLSDDDTAGFISDARHREFRGNIAALADAIRNAGSNPLAAPAVGKALDRLFDDYFGSAA